LSASDERVAGYYGGRHENPKALKIS
jgi:hypothetical protein